MSDSTKVTFLSVLLIILTIATVFVNIERDDLRKQLRELQSKPLECLKTELPSCPEPIVITKVDDTPPPKPTIEDIHYGIDKRGKCFAWGTNDKDIKSVDCKYLTHRPFSPHQ